MNSFLWDIFISYSHEDNDRVQRDLVVPLEEQGFTLRLDKHFTLGRPLIDDITESIRKSRITILAISENYFQSAWTKFEATLLHTIQIQERSSRLIPVRLEKVSLPDNLNSLVYCEYEQAPEKLVELFRRNPPLSLQFSRRGRVLAVGSHWDDILLGCLGTLIKLKRIKNFEVDVVVLCNSYNKRYYGELQDNLDQKAKGMYVALCKACEFNNLGLADRISSDLRDRELTSNAPLIAQEIANIIDRSKEAPYNLILSPPRNDENADHALAGNIVLDQFRHQSHQVLEYAIKSSTESSFAPNIFVGLDDDFSLPGEQTQTVVDAKIGVIKDKCKITSELIKNCERLFSTEALRAQLLVNALDLKNRSYRHAEIFKGRLEL
jgi:LmbE family N-acetylglucosaminyl deacetylase